MWLPSDSIGTSNCTDRWAENSSFHIPKIHYSLNHPNINTISFENLRESLNKAKINNLY